MYPKYTQQARWDQPPKHALLLTHAFCKKSHFEDCLASCFGPDIATVAAADMAAAAALNFAPPAAFAAPAIFANAATPPTSIALRATVGFIVISYGIPEITSATLECQIYI